MRTKQATYVRHRCECDNPIPWRGACCWCSGTVATVNEQIRHERLKAARRVGNLLREAREFCCVTKTVPNQWTK